MNRAAGPFEILEVLGEGSFGTVCVARVTGDPLRRKVALKILKGTYARNQKILNRTRDEARLLSRISHPNIVRVERLMDVGGRPVVVMEHVQGVSLDQLLHRFKQGVPPAVAVEATRQACLALHVAYNEVAGEDGRPLRVIHRDIKPSNVMLSIHGEVKVLDFGIAKGEFEGREAETESVVMGSRPYMAPERLDGVSDSPSVDVYSSGMSLFELLTGRTMSLSINPITHDQAMNRQLKFISVEGMSATALEDLRGVIRRMCAYDRDHRPTAHDASRQLEQLMYAIDPAHRIPLEEFARTVVLPLYESRPRIPPEEATRATEDEEFFREVTGQFSRSSSRSGVVRGETNWVPYVFVGVLALLLVLFGGLALNVMLSRNSAPAMVDPVTAPSVAGDGKVEVRIWIPSDAQAQVAGQFVPQASKLRLYEGPTLMELYFDDNSELACEFMATEGAAVRYVGEQAISVNDGAAVPCTVTREPSEAG